MTTDLAGRYRIRKSLNHEEPDRVPIDLGGWQSGINWHTYEEVKRILGIEKPTRIAELFSGVCQVDEEALEQFNVDTRYIFPSPSVKDNPYKNKKVDTVVDEWGIKWHRPEYSLYYDMVGFLLNDVETPSDLEKYVWPDPSNIQSRERLIEDCESEKRKDKAIFTCLASVFEQATYTRGMQNFYMDAYTNPDLFEAMLDKVLEIELERYTLFFDAVGDYLDVVEFWCDLGAQTGPIIAPELYRTTIKPREVQLIDLVRKKTNAKVALHSCGACFDFLPDVIDAGYEILNPIQTNASGMDPISLKNEFGKDLCFWGAIDTQKILPFGTVQDVKDEVKKVIDILGPGGGFILAPCHCIQADTPPGNVIALFEAAIEYGKY